MQLSEKNSLRDLIRASLVTAFSLAWVSLFWVQPARGWPWLSTVITSIDRGMADLTGLDILARWVVTGYVFVLVPIACLRLAGISFRQMALGWPHRDGWRLAGAGLGLAVPVLVILGMDSSMQQFYGPMLGPGALQVVCADALVIVIEHAWSMGVTLALAVPPPGVEGPAIVAPRPGWLAFLGLGRRPGQSGIAAWLGLRPDIWPAVIGQAVVFTVVHLGKETVEILAAFPGALGLAILTLRSRSIWPGVVVHLATGAILLAVVYLGR